MPWVLALMPRETTRRVRTHRSVVSRSHAGPVRTALTMEELTVGASFADHEIVGVAGRGAMGVVYRARQDGRDVALKVLAAGRSHDTEFRIRFQREYERDVSIRHPNVVRVFGAGAKDGRLYVTMQYIEGSDLASLLKRGRLEPAVAARR